MNHIGEVEIEHPDLALIPTLRSIDGLRIQVESQPVTDLESPVLFYLVEVPSFQRFESTIVDDHTVANWKCTSKLDDNRIYQLWLSAETKIVSPKMSDLGLHILSAIGRSDADGSWHLRMRMPDRNRLVQFLMYCQQENISCRVRKLYSSSERGDVNRGTEIIHWLTDRQYEVARTATQMGYFDQNGASAEEVAEELDITPSTLSSHLRNVKVKLFEELFDS